MTRPLAYVSPDLSLTVWQDGQAPVRIQLDRAHAFALLRDLASALGEGE
jgi:hypothetical protein